MTELVWKPDSKPVDVSTWWEAPPELTRRVNEMITDAFNETPPRIAFDFQFEAYGKLDRWESIGLDPLRMCLELPLTESLDVFAEWEVSLPDMLDYIVDGHKNSHGVVVGDDGKEIISIMADALEQQALRLRAILAASPPPPAT